MFQRESAWTRAVDRVGMFVSAACFLHCLVTPVVFSLLAVYAHVLPSMSIRTGSWRSAYSSRSAGTSDFTTTGLVTPERT